MDGGNDDMAVGGGRGGGADDNVSSAQQADHSGPLEQRLVSKNWQVRAKAYEDLQKEVEGKPANNKGDTFREHVG